MNQIHQQPVTISVAQAAELMDLSRRQARRRLLSIHESHPGLGLLEKPLQDGGRANHRVNVRALRRLLLDTDGVALRDLEIRVGLLESDRNTLQARIGRVEKYIRPQQNSQNMQSANWRNGT